MIEVFNSGKFENFKIKSVFVLDQSYGNYIPFDELLEGKNQIPNRVPDLNFKSIKIPQQVIVKITRDYSLTLK